MKWAHWVWNMLVRLTEWTEETGVMTSLKEHSSTEDPAALTIISWQYHGFPPPLTLYIDLVLGLYICVLTQHDRHTREGTDRGLAAVARYAASLFFCFLFHCPTWQNKH